MFTLCPNSPGTLADMLKHSAIFVDDEFYEFTEVGLVRASRGSRHAVTPEFRHTIFQNFASRLKLLLCVSPVDCTGREGLAPKME